MTSLEKRLLEIICKLIIWILKQNSLASKFASFYNTLPIDIRQIICAIRYLGQTGSAYKSYEEAINDIQQPGRFSSQALTEKITEIIPQTLENQLNNGIKRL